MPFFSAADVLRAVTPADAYAAVRDAFVAHARGEWAMQPKLYVTNYPAGDFRAMPALGGGHALLKWVTSFPGNPARGLPTVTGLVLVSDAETGMLAAVLDAGCGHGVAHGCGGGDRRRRPRTDGRPRGDRGRRRRERSRRGADVRRARTARRGMGRGHAPRGGGRERDRAAAWPAPVRKRSMPTRSSR